MCLVRAACCKFSNADRFERNNKCDGLNYLLNSYLADDVRDYYLDVAVIEK